MPKPPKPPPTAQTRTVELGGNSFQVKPSNVVRYLSRKPRGKTTNAHLFEFFRTVFQKNEEWKLTDPHLVDLVVQEFSEYPEVAENIQGNERRANKIPKYRSLYNTGELGVLPEQVSLAYSEEKQPIQYPRKVLTNAECAEKARHYKIPDRRFLSVEEAKKIANLRMQIPSRQFVAEQKEARRQKKG